MLRHSGCAGWRRRLRAAVMPVVVWAAIAGSAGWTGLVSQSVFAKDGPKAQTVSIAFAQLPPQGRDVMTLIYQGGPFRHDKDGAVFGNRERILPARNRGFYREYTVRTPGERTRGARRIICGGVKPVAPEACYYTADHYASFRRIVE